MKNPFLSWLKWVPAQEWASQTDVSGNVLRPVQPLNGTFLTEKDGTTRSNTIEGYWRYEAMEILERDVQIMGMLREGTNHVNVLVSRSYGETNERLGFLAHQQVVAHLKELEEDRRAVPANTYRPA